MRAARVGNGGWAAFVAVLVVAVGGAGIAAARSTAGLSHTLERSVLNAASVTDTNAAAPPTSSTTTTPPTTAPETTTTTAPTKLATTVPVTVAKPATTVVRSSSAAPTTTVTTPTTTTVVPVSPSSWAVEKDGVSVRVRIDPDVPRAGQSLRIIIDTSSSKGGYCCLNLLTVNGVQEPLPKGGSAMDANGATITSTHEEQTWTVPGSGWLNLDLAATSLPPLASPAQGPQPVLVRLIGSTPIVP